MTRSRHTKRSRKSGKASNQSQTDTKTPQALKPESKIAKRSPDQSLAKSKASTPSPNIEDQKKRKGGNDKKESGNAVTKEEENNKEKLGGMIFMCNQNTKPDCYRYMVMGLPESKKELVMKIKPGLKLFLFDCDAKLLYGVYKASSAGGMKLEPSAFKGSYPAQVRFEVHKYVSPIAYNVFKSAIKNNYDAKRNWFKMELTVQQVKKLLNIFHNPPRLESDAITIIPIEQAPILLAPPKPIVPIEDPLLTHPDIISRGPYVPDEARLYYMPHMYKESAPAPREAVPHDPFLLSEKDYRTFGLKPPSSASIPAPATPAFDTSLATKAHSYPYGSASDRYSPALGRAPYLSGLNYQTDSSRRRVEETKYNLWPVIEQSSIGGNNHPSNSYGIPRRDEVEYGRHSDEVGRMHSSFAANALSGYNQRYQLPGSRADPESMPVSSRYSFAGPSLSYR